MKQVWLLTILWIITHGVKAQDATDGQQLFQQRCAACHKVGQVLTGPDLNGVHERRPEDWLIKFIKSSQSVIRSGDQYAVDLFNKFNRIPMPDQPDLSDSQVKNILAYIKQEGEKIGSNQAPFGKVGKQQPKYLPVSFSNNSAFIYAYLGIVVILVLVMLMAVEVKVTERKKYAETNIL